MPKTLKKEKNNKYLIIFHLNSALKKRPMVFEQIYKISWISQRASFAFVLGITYSVLGIFSGIYLFPESPGLATLAFTSLLLLPTLNKFLLLEENVLSYIRSYNPIVLLREHKDIFKIYFFIFMGVFLTYAIFSIFLPKLATSAFFTEQTRVLGYSGRAFSAGFFWSILSNNFIVLLFCFIGSFIYGAGSIFIIIWNASVWGVFFGLLAKKAALVTGLDPLIYFTVVLLVISPHMISEASAYFLTAIAGGIISKAALREEALSPKFNHIMADAIIVFAASLVVLVIAAFLEVLLAGAEIIKTGFFV